LSYLENKSVLITGGTGSFGKRFTQHLIENEKVKKIVIYSRDEYKQFMMQSDPRFCDFSGMRYFIGDVRDKTRLARAFDGIDVVIHAAALKHVPAAEYNPFEAVKTNVIGSQNVINCSIDKDVKKIVALSTDKAANPINLYGADKLFMAGNAYAGSRDTIFSVVRYGNVVGSRGSVVPFFLNQRKSGVLTVTDDKMTRFWITLDQAVNFVIGCLENMVGGEMFVPKIPSMKITDLAKVIGKDCKIEIIGIRPGEKLHEVMVTVDDARNTIECPDHYMILPSFDWKGKDKLMEKGEPCAENFKYSSDTNSQWLLEEDLKTMISKLDLPEAREFALEEGIIES
jgi:UDP-N-acetylglucosamine 4,6-dehydratase/5-epimerase